MSIRIVFRIWRLQFWSNDERLRYITWDMPDHHIVLWECKDKP